MSVVRYFKVCNVSRKFMLWISAVVAALPLGFSFFTKPVFASRERPEDGQEYETIAAQVTGASVAVPGMIASVCFLLALLFSCLGVLKLRARRNDPDNVPLSQAVFMFGLAGLFFLLDIVFWGMSDLTAGVTAESVAGRVSEAEGNVIRPSPILR